MNGRIDQSILDGEGMVSVSGGYADATMALYPSEGIDVFANLTLQQIHRQYD